MKRPAFWGLLLIIMGGLVLGRHLEDRPMHNDEAVNAWFLTHLVEDGNYRYDPTNYHGPSLFYYQRTVTWVNNFLHHPFQFPLNYPEGITATSVRAGVVIAALVLLLTLWKSEWLLGGWGTVAAIVLLLFSPDFMFFSRYFIHEALFILFTLWLVLASIRFHATQKPWLYYALMASGALLFTTKETSVIVLAVLVLAWICAEITFALLTKKNPLQVLPRMRQERIAETRALRWHVVGGKALAIAIWAILFTSFFTHREGMLDSIRTYSTWIETGTVSGHNKTFRYFFRWLLLPYEKPLLFFALIGIGLAVIKKNKTALFLSSWGVGIFLAHSLIPYKTPWLVMNMLMPMALISGWGVNELVLMAGSRSLLEPQFRRGVFLLTIGALLLTLQIPVIYRLLFVEYDNDFHPQVYAHTTREIYALVDQVNIVAESSRLREAMPINVVSTVEWPLPYYLRDFKQTYYWRRYEGIPELTTPVIIAEETQREGLKKLLPPLYIRQTYSLRPGVLIDLYIAKEYAAGLTDMSHE